MRKRGKSFKQLDPFSRFGLGSSKQMTVALTYHGPLANLVQGNGCDQDWANLACAMNVSLLLAEEGNGAGCIETIKLAQEALMRTYARAASKGKWGLDGDGLRVLQASVDILDEQISRTTRGRVQAALDEVYRRIEAGEVFTVEQVAA